MNPRYFIGITLPDELSAAISKAQKKFFIPGKIMEPLVPHLTLLDPNLLMELSPIYFLPKVKKAAEATLPFEATLTDFGMFDDRVLFISAESPELINLRKDLVELIPEKIRAQYTVHREYVPHVTLAQTKPNQILTDQQVTNIKNKVQPLLPQKMMVKNLDQFQWIRPRTYEVKVIK
jgi:2'-5' RNA ligase